jgi:hypothetical protein
MLKVQITRGGVAFKIELNYYIVESFMPISQVVNG